MNRIDKYGYWLMLADYDLKTIDCLIEGKRWVYVAYLSQQAIERQLKGMYVYYLDAEAPKTHNVNFLFNKMAQCAQFLTDVDIDRFNERKIECEDFLVDVMFYYMSDYPFSYKNIRTRFVDEEVALELYERAKDFVMWLRSFQPPVDVPSV